MEEGPELWVRVSRKDLQGVSDWLHRNARDGTPVDMEERGGPFFKNTALYLAVGDAPSVDMVRLLLEFNADPNTTDHRGQSPLHLIDCQTPPEIARLLLGAGADPRRRDDYGYTPLFTMVYPSARHGGTCNAETLLEHGADVNSRTLEGQTALMEAVYTRRLDMVKLLLRYDANMDLANVYHRTAMAYALDHHAGQQPLLPYVHALRQEELSRMSLAFAMGQHERLGAGTWSHGLHPDALRMIDNHFIHAP